MTAGVDPFHERVARIALGVADRYGFVLGGGLARLRERFSDWPR